MGTIFSECTSWIFPFFTNSLICCFSAYVGILLIIKLNPDIILEILFLNKICPPKWFTKLHCPQKRYKLKGCTNYYIESKSGNTLGVWHILPTSKYDSPGGSSRTLKDAEKVVVYCHGNAFHRGFWHRLDLYRSLQKDGYHVVTFDYSGFGDSSGRPNPEAVVLDTVTVYKWTVDQIENADASISLWGHSLGTGVSSKALMILGEENSTKLPDALVLEAPFTNIVEAADTFPLSKLFYTIYPFLKKEVHQSVYRNKADFATEKVLPCVTTPILILHAEDDHKIPLFLGEKLYRKTTSDPDTRSKFIRFIRMHKKHSVQHYTALHPGICEIFEDFMEEVQRLNARGQQEPRFETIDV